MLAFIRELCRIYEKAEFMINLHEDKEIFEQYISSVTTHLGLKDEAIVEKDYYVVQFLKKLAEKQPDLIFKGGTSLSKAHKIIKRFSEDIDITLRAEADQPNPAQRLKLDENIRLITKELGLKIVRDFKNPDKRDFCAYTIEYTPIFETDGIESNILIEASFFIKSFPDENLQISSFICDFISMHDGGQGEIEKYGLQPFSLPIQSLARTFIDKVFAVLDYQLDNKRSGEYKNKLKGKSRHIYDLYKLYPQVKMDDTLIGEVFRVVGKKG
jgi:predicted nucleotidyltransferase component of viral defense system